MKHLFCLSCPLVKFADPLEGFFVIARRYDEAISSYQFEPAEVKQSYLALS